MVVAIDTLFMSERFRYTGTGMYLRHLLSACLKLVERSIPGAQFHGFRTPMDNWAGNGFNSPFLRVHPASTMARRRVWLLGGMALHTARVRPGLVFLPTAHHSLPLPSAPVVTTIHDALPKQLPPEVVRHATPLHVMTWLNARLASQILTVSSWSRQALIDVYGLPPGKIQVVYNGFDQHLYNSQPPDSVASAALLARFGIRPPFVLHHGMVQLRKNVHRLIAAWDRVAEHCRSFDAQLVLAGPRGLGYEEIAEVGNASPNRRRIIFTGPLPDDELAILVKNASLSVIPSLAEGFGLPMVEAMACGVPTVAANNSCLPEVSGGVLEYFNPYSIEEMAEVIRRGLEDSDLRSRLRTSGLARAAEFSWERSARETLRVFAETVKAHA